MKFCKLESIRLNCSSCCRAIALDLSLMFEECLMDGAIPIEVSVLFVLRREENSPYRLLLVV
jgi:hypothetical protein